MSNSISPANFQSQAALPSLQRPSTEVQQPRPSTEPPEPAASIVPKEDAHVYDFKADAKSRVNQDRPIEKTTLQKEEVQSLSARANPNAIERYTAVKANQPLQPTQQGFASISIMA